MSPVPDHLSVLYQETTNACTHPQEQKAIAMLLSKYSDVLSSGEHGIASTDLVKHSIEVGKGARPIKQAPHRLGAEREAEVDRQIQKLCHQGIDEQHRELGACQLCWSRKRMAPGDFVLTIGG